ncbi:MAG: 1-deoxy-D-xylulose-5-phosphate reductoisomerase [Bacilli bacterium]|nr:1-deoxy-D-xylulose-5-phosphate reductoisomerase [Bacilli bacterium]
MRKVLLLGASGSIGTQTLDVIERERDQFVLTAFSLGHRVEYVDIVLANHPSVTRVCVQEKADYDVLTKKYPNITFYYGDEGLVQIIDEADCDMVVNALVGFSGMVPSVESLKKDKILCLANKESLVVGGDLIKDLLKNGHGVLYPIDSEHVAIAKMIAKSGIENVEKILITGSGGPFRKMKREELASVTPEQALNHPTWKMGAKITIDSATMMNKGFEVVEACRLFDCDPSFVEVILHDESHVHSMLKLKDGTFVADISAPDMRVPIYWALHEGNCEYKVFKSPTIEGFGDYHFHKFDPSRYPAVKIATDAYSQGGVMPAVLNAANEVAVHAFLDGKIPFLAIEEVIKDALMRISNEKNPTLSDLIKTDKKTRSYTIDATRRYVCK